VRDIRGIFVRNWTTESIVVASGATWAADHPFEAAGILVGGLAAATGIGALAEAGLAAGFEVGAESVTLVSEGSVEAEDAANLAQSLGRLSVSFGVTSLAADIPACVDNPSLPGCLGVALGLASAGLGFGGLLSPSESILGGILSSKAFGLGVAGLTWDIFGAPSFARASSSTSSCS
jgi:hypothetical protein